MAEPVAIGIDVGGTNTDAVALATDGRVLARIKTPTTLDPAAGIAGALEAVASAGDVTRVALGTTHATNAIVQRQGLRRVTVLRLGAPGSTAVPPFAGWPRDLVEAVAGRVLVARGGVEVDGRTVPLDPDEIKRFGESAGDMGAIAVTGIFSPLDDGQEREAFALLAEVTDLPVTRGHEVGGLGLLERENAAILNASLGEVMSGVIDGLLAAAAKIGAHVPTYLTQNDGTLMTPAFARRLPVLTIGSGPSNSLRGAAVLTGRTDCLVVDVGGTTSDVGALRQGFPRESAVGRFGRRRADELPDAGPRLGRRRRRHGRRGRPPDRAIGRRRPRHAGPRVRRRHHDVHRRCRRGRPRGDRHGPRQGRPRRRRACRCRRAGRRGGAPNAHLPRPDRRARHRRGRRAPRGVDSRRANDRATRACRRRQRDRRGGGPDRGRGRPRRGRRRRRTRRGPRALPGRGASPRHRGGRGARVPRDGLDRRDSARLPRPPDVADPGEGRRRARPSARPSAGCRRRRRPRRSNTPRPGVSASV